MISTYPTLEARLFHAVEQVLNDSPAKGRVNQRVFFIITEHKEAKEWLGQFLIDTPQECIPVAFLSRDLLANHTDSWFVRNEIANQLYTKDLFNVQLPINTDLSFFGRNALVTDFVQSISQSRNRGLFGLRKTGKTSFLYKVKRHAERQGCGVIYLDCKLPAIRNLDWVSLLQRICMELRTMTKGSVEKGIENKHIADQFVTLLKSTPNKTKICIIFDEIEYISPLAKLDKHWHQDFVPFWQTLWSAQSALRRLSVIVAGVNAYVTELDTVDGVQNPMFGIVPHRYLKGFEREELKTMIRTIGRRMGLRFTTDAIDYMYERYGGHPLLTRMACSHVHNKIELGREKRPFDISDRFLKAGEQQREEELSYYSGHVVWELREFYPDEYKLLGDLASGNEAEFVDWWVADPDFTKHLSDYGLVEVGSEGHPKIKISVVGKYLSYEMARGRGTRRRKYIIPQSERKGWLSLRLRSIVEEIRNLTQIARDQGLLRLYGRKTLGEMAQIEKMGSMFVVREESEFLTFINQCNLLMVEALISDLEEVQRVYPDLWDALLRIKTYRHDQVHLRLTPKVQDNLSMYLDRDLEGMNVAAIADGHFILQQSVVDSLFAAILYEVNRHQVNLYEGD